MNDLINKLSSYNLFNYLFPGVVFCAFADKLFSYSLVQKDIVVGVFLYYFAGLVISRVGSLVIEPFFQWVHLVNFSDYQDFVAASKNDSKLEALSEVNNMYRTIVSLSFVLIVLAIFEAIKPSFPDAANYIIYVVIVGFIVMFSLSYRKQTAYISKRVAANKAGN